MVMNRIMWRCILLTAVISFHGVSANLDNFKGSFTDRTLQAQRLLDLYAPIADNNILGTHNSYNSIAYSSFTAWYTNGFRYIFPQQSHTITEQLALGARFIELDVHWTLKMKSFFNYRYDLLLCHGLCSVHDKYLSEGLSEIATWLASAESENQVLIILIEDHMDGAHEQAYQLLQQYLAPWLYVSNGCLAIPNTLTKATLLAQGKKVLVWNQSPDGRCYDNSAYQQVVFSELGDISRKWEDRTAYGLVYNSIQSGRLDVINAQDVRQFFKQGENIVNLDYINSHDGRLAAGIWSWDINEPNNSQNEDCAVQWHNGRWNDAQCTHLYAAACYQASNQQWQVTSVKGTWWQGESLCQQLAPDAHFQVPTNSFANTQLQKAKQALGYQNVWLNHDDRQVEGQWRVNGKVTTEQALTNWRWQTEVEYDLSYPSCASQGKQSYWHKEVCQQHYVFACRNSQTNSWQVTNQQNSWFFGQQACQQLGDNMHFSAPVTIAENQLLAIIKMQSGYDSVWLNYP